MNNEQQIKALLDTQELTNHLLALELLKGQFDEDWTAVFLYLLDYYWKDIDEDYLDFKIGSVSITFWIGVVYPKGLKHRRKGNLCLDTIIEGNTVVRDEWILDEVDREKTYYLNDYKELVTSSLKQQVPIILKQLNY